MIKLLTTASEAACLALVRPGGPHYAGQGWMVARNIGQALDLRAALPIVDEVDEPLLLITRGQREREALFVACCATQGAIR